MVNYEKKKLRGRGTSAKWRYKRHKIVFWNRSYKTHPLFCSLPFPDSLMGQRSYLSIDSGTRWGENRVWKVCFSLEILSWRTFFYRSGTFTWHSSTADIHEAVITVNPHLWKKTQHHHWSKHHHKNIQIWISALHFRSRFTKTTTAAKWFESHYKSQRDTWSSNYMCPKCMLGFSGHYLK